MVKMIYDRIDDKVLCRFLEAHLNKKEVEYNGEIIEEEKGVMAGTPISPFLANLYLTDLDETFKGDLYARYADDIIFFARTSEERDEKEKKLLEFVYEKESVSKTQRRSCGSESEKNLLRHRSFGRAGACAAGTGGKNERSSYS